MTDQINLKVLLEKANDVMAAFEEKKKAVETSPELKIIDDLRVEFLGRKGHVTGLMEHMKGLSKEERPEAGKNINILRKSIEKTIETLKNKAENWQLEKHLSRAKLDISLPADTSARKGSLHPVTLMRSALLEEFRALGFKVYDGPEVDLDKYNFSSLNFKDDHPARDMQDTFLLKIEKSTVLRTHTSNIQIHAMLNEKPPIKMVAPGRTYRCDSDLTHTPMFHQIEAVVVDKDISMADMKGIVDKFLKAIFGSDLETDLRPSYFPFVEPGGEVDIQCTNCKGKGCRICSDTGWIEIGGLGMIHPNVFEAVDLDSESYTGFAFGFGIDRIAMMKFGLKDLRQLFEGDEAFLNQFPIQTNVNK